MSKRKMTEDKLLSILQKRESDAAGYVWGELGAQREDAMRSYHRMPYGNEEDGWSQIVTSDVHDSVEWVLPSLLRIFTSTDRAVSFDPETEADVDSAEQATDACNYVFYKQNNGFMVLYTALKDALIAKNAAVHWRNETKETVTTQPFSGASVEMLALITKDGAEIIEANPEVVQDELGNQVQMFSGKLRLTEKKKIIKISAFSPEDLLVDVDWTSPMLQDCPYVARLMRVTASDVVEMGFNVDPDDVASSDGADSSPDKSFRMSRIGQSDTMNESGAADDDESQNEGWLRLEYVLVDYDGDGIAERREIIRLKDKILSNEIVSHVPIATASPILITHRWDGQSLAEIVDDIQKLHTELMRQSLNSLYLSNNPRTKVLTDSNWNPQANIDDLLESRPGGLIREKVPNAVNEYVTPWVGQGALGMMEYVQAMKENRTGSTRYNQGTDANTLNKTATGINAIMSASQQRIELMARVFAETLMKPIFQGILKLLSEGGMDKLAFRLRDKFVQYDPNDWRDWYDMTINVGLGTGNTNDQIGRLNGILQAQVGMLKNGLGMVVTPKNIYNTNAKIVEASGFKNVSDYWTDPEPKDAQQNPQMMQMQIQQMQQQLQGLMQQHQQMAQENAAMKIDLKNKQGELMIKAEEVALKDKEIDKKYNAEGVKAEAEVVIANIEARSNERIAAMEAKIDVIQSLGNREPVVVNTGGSRRKTVAIQAPSGQTYTGVIEEEGEEGETEE